MSADGMTLSHAAVTISRFRGESFLLTTNQIRQQFLEYFEKNQHRRVSSSSLVPAADPTLLFTNAGMNQFNEGFIGLEPRGHHQPPTPPNSPPSHAQPPP